MQAPPRSKPLPNASSSMDSSNFDPGCEAFARVAFNEYKVVGGDDCVGQIDVL